MKPSKAVLIAVKSGRGVIPVGTQGKVWNAYKRAEHLQFPGDTAYELVAPNGQEWLATFSTGCQPMVFRI